MNLSKQVVHISIFTLSNVSYVHGDRRLFFQVRIENALNEQAKEMRIVSMKYFHYVVILSTLGNTHHLHLYEAFLKVVHYLDMSIFSIQSTSGVRVEELT